MAINTVTGTISLDQLGTTMMHEHIIVALDGTFLDSTMHFDWQAIEDEAVKKLKAVKEIGGVQTFVDLTTIEMGRDVELMRRISERSEVSIIFTTGLFADAYGIPHYFRDLSDEDITELYVHEIEEGVGPNHLKAGVIKVATGARELTELEVRIVRAAGKAAVATGVPVLTHTGRGGGGIEQIQLLQEVGVPLTKMVIGHSDVSADLRYHTKMLRMGAFVGMDRIGLTAFMPEAIRVGCISALIKMGYAKQLTMSLDAHVRWCGRPNPLTVEDRQFTYLFEEFFPMLKEAGVTDADLHQVMVENPKTVFTEAKK
jgi:phosphotriesterase-related protein